MQDISRIVDIVFPLAEQIRNDYPAKPIPSVVDVTNLALTSIASRGLNIGMSPFALRTAVQNVVTVCLGCIPLSDNVADTELIRFAEEESSHARWLRENRGVYFIEWDVISNVQARFDAAFPDTILHYPRVKHLVGLSLGVSDVANMIAGYRALRSGPEAMDDFSNGLKDQ